MEDAATVIQGHFRMRQKKKHQKTQQQSTPQEDTNYDRDAEKDQEIGEEFLIPDEDMERAAQTI